MPNNRLNRTATAIYLQTVGKQASLNRSWQSNKSTIRAYGLAGIEPNSKSWMQLANTSWRNFGPISGLGRSCLYINPKINGLCRYVCMPLTRSIDLSTMIVRLLRVLFKFDTFHFTFVAASFCKKVQYQTKFTSFHLEAFGCSRWRARGSRWRAI